MAVPSTPANLTIDKVGSNAIFLSWDNVVGELGFNIYRSEDDITYVHQEIIDTDTLTYWDGLVEVLTTYYYKISATNLDGESALSSAVHDTTLDKESATLERSALGPFSYDKNSLYNKDNEYKSAIRGEQISITESPTEDGHVVRYEDIKINQVSATEDYTASFLDLILCDGAFNITLPNIETEDIGKEIIVINNGVGKVLVYFDEDDLLYEEDSINCIPGSTLALRPITTSEWGLV